MVGLVRAACVAVAVALFGVVAVVVGLDVDRGHSFQSYPKIIRIYKYRCICY